MPLFSDENRIRELERKVNRMIAENRDLRQQMLQAQQLARSLANTQAQGGQQQTSGSGGPIRGAQTTSTISAGSGSGGSGSGTATVYILNGAGRGASASITVYNSFTGTIPTATWVLVQLDDSGAYQIVAEQC